MVRCFRSVRASAVVAIGVFIVACTTDPPLTASHDFSKARHIFSVEFPFPAPERMVRQLLGMQGSPAAVVPGDPDIVQSYKTYNFEMVRVPQDDFCTYTLEGIFQDPDAPESDVSSYEFGNIDRLLEGIVEADSKIMWQGNYDLGIADGCGETDGRHSGAVLRDPTKYVNVVNNVLRHFNEGKSEWDPDGRKFGIEYVEFVNDPMGLGGYSLSNFDEFLEHFQVFSLGIRAAAFGGGASKITRIVGPAHRIRSWPIGRIGEKEFLYDFIDLVADQSIALDVFSLQLRFDNPYELARAVDDIRDYLDDRALVEIPIWVTEIAPSPETEAALRDAPGDAYERFVGAHLVAAKIAWQETAVRAFPHRGTRRLDGGSAGIIESPFFDADGNERGGLLGFTAFQSFDDEVILKGSAVTSDGVALLASRSQKNNMISVLASYPGTNDSKQSLLVPIILNGIPEDITEIEWEFSKPSESEEINALCIAGDFCFRDFNKFGFKDASGLL